MVTDILSGGFLFPQARVLGKLIHKSLDEQMKLLVSSYLPTQLPWL
jgi:hypothetical protein